MFSNFGMRIGLIKSRGGRGDIKKSDLQRKGERDLLITELGLTDLYGMLEF